MTRRARLVLITLGLLASGSRAAAQSVLVGARGDPAAGIIVGQVCEDRDGDGACGQADAPIPAALVTLDDGTFALTDSLGRYHLRAIPARPVQALSTGVREGFGRRWLALQAATLGHAVDVAGGAARPVEIAPASLTVEDFAVRFRRGPVAAIASEANSHGDVRGEALVFTAAGRVQPGHRVWVAGRAVTPLDTGEFTAEVELQAGENQIPIVDLAPDGELALSVERVAVLTRRRGGVLFVPHPFEVRALLLLPPADRSPEGEFIVPIEAPAGTRVRLGSAEAVIGPEGAGRATVALARGARELPLRIDLPGETSTELTLPLEVRPADVMLGGGGLELGFDPKRRFWTASGRGALALRRSFGDWELRGGLNLDTTDLQQLTGRSNGTPGGGADPGLLLQPRRPLQFERALDPRTSPPIPGDTAVEGSWNPGDQRLWARLAHPRYGAAEVGAIRPEDGGSREVGAYRRDLFGAQVAARIPLAAKATATVSAFGAPALSGAAGEPVAAPAHDVFESTGGTLYFLRHVDVVPGSERVRVEVRDGLTGAPQQVTRLERGRDYEFDFVTGRLLLARPLPMHVGLGPLVGVELASARPAVVVDYDYLAAGLSGSDALGARVGAEYARAAVSAGVVREQRRGAAPDYRLASAQATVPAGPVEVVAEASRSEGQLFGGASSFNWSDTAGLGFVSSSAITPGAADAVSVRARYEEPGQSMQLWARAAEPGYSDSDHGADVAVRQFGGRGTVRLGRLELSALADGRAGPDPRDPFGAATAVARDAVARAAFGLGDLTLRAETRAALLRIGALPGAPLEEGGRVAAGVGAEYRLDREFAVDASHQQRLYAFGAGPGARDDTFSAVGFAYRPVNDVGFGVRAGWGPAVGTQVQLRGETDSTQSTSYGSVAMGVDGPQAGQATAASGASQRVDATDFFVEDFFTRDLDGLRAGRAVGVTTSPAEAVQFGARYERAARLPFEGAPPLLRDTLAARASAQLAWLRLGGVGEVRRERGDAVVEQHLSRWQLATGLSADAQPTRTFGLRAGFTRARTLDSGEGARELYDAFVSAALRGDGWAVLTSWSVLDADPLALGSAERLLVHLLSVRPAVALGQRFRLASGLNASFFRAGGPSNVLAASLRPSVRLPGGLEAAVEGAARTRAPAGETLTAGRVELAWWLMRTASVALGYNAYGFSGTGVAPALERTGRVYLRVEAGY